MGRELSVSESQNFKFLKKFSTSISHIIVTETGLAKATLDATYVVRLFLKENHIHDFDLQKQGQGYKKMVNSFYYAFGKFNPVNASLYRPETKNGDPRIWFSGMAKLLEKPSALALIAIKKEIYIINLSEFNFENAFVKDSIFRDFLDSLKNKEEEVALELLKKMHEIYKLGWVEAVGHGDTSVGATLESLLGLKTNSSKNPDYKGIELKSYRIGKLKSNRSNLFAQVADWCASPVKSSGEVLLKFGYPCEKNKERRKLYCTVSSRGVNPQGLILKIDEKNECIAEIHKDFGVILKWPFSLLIERLKTKHNETFWVEAECRTVNKKEQFQYTKITHTKSPILTELIPLISKGVITMDHLISSTNGKKVIEKGPLFKIDKKNLDLLFPDKKIIVLKDYK